MIVNKPLIKFQSLPKIIFLLGFLMLPFIFWPKAVIPYEIPRVWFVQRWVEILGIASLINIFSLKKKRINLSLFLFVLVFIILAFLSSVFGADFQKSFFGNYYRGDGLLTLLHLFLLFLFLLLFFKSSWHKSLAWVVVLGSFAVSIWSLISNFGFYLLDIKTIMNFDGIIGGSFGQPNFLAGYILVSLPFTSYLFFKLKNKKNKNFLKIVLMFQVLAILFVFSRGAVLGLILFAIGFALMNEKTPIRRFFGVAILSWFVLFSILMISVFSERTDLTVESRQRIFTKGVLSLESRPFLGWGLANFDHAFESIDWPIHFNHDIYVDKAHSHFLEVLVTTGLFGFFSYIGIIILVLCMFYKYLKRGENIFWYKTLFLSFLLFLLHSQTNVISIGEEVFFWMILGIMGAKLLKD